MGNREAVIFVSRKGTASDNIDADPAYRAIYEARAQRRKIAQRQVARWIAVVLALLVGVAAYVVTRRTHG